ncbi:hypothetical protein LSM04_005133 [Trypanosoma melophagium]|uniref:uncharacterized protein n=1 Tax=Trypanosoma melophagium TaxID=715481 RepID=UPI00351A53E1|nr:hypothetical protein LSM04_005133 [Trypanosoma melophagium]
MKPTAKLWLEEKKRRLNTLPVDEDMRMRRLKERLNPAATRVLVNTGSVGTCISPSTPVSDAASSLLNQNIALLTYIDELQENYFQSEKQREIHWNKLQETSNENYRLVREIITLSLDRRKDEVLLKEKRFREKLMLQESDARVDLAITAARLFTPSDFRSSHQLEPLLFVNEKLRIFYETDLVYRNSSLWRVATLQQKLRHMEMLQRRRIAVEETLEFVDCILDDFLLPVQRRGRCLGQRVVALLQLLP